MKNPLIYIAATLFLAVAAFLLFNNKTQPKQSPLSESTTQNKANEEIANTQTPNNTEVNGSRYINYSQSAFDEANDKKRVYFFHATWCPTCKAANREFTDNPDKIPTDVILFKTDYDNEKELKKRYGITYQHTFVYVNEDGNEIKKWNGGAIDDLIFNTQ